MISLRTLSDNPFAGTNQGFIFRFLRNFINSTQWTEICAKQFTEQNNRYYKSNSGKYLHATHLAWKRIMRNIMRQCLKPSERAICLRIMIHSGNSGKKCYKQDKYTPLQGISLPIFQLFHRHNILKIIPFFHHFHSGLFQETPFAEIIGQAYEDAAAEIVPVSILHIFGGCDVGE